MPAMRTLALCVVLATASATAHAEAGPKDRKLARILSGTAASVSGGVVLTGFMLARDGDAFNTPVLYTGLGMLMVTPSLGEFYAGQYLTWGMGVRAVATGFALYTLENYTYAVRCPAASGLEGFDCTNLEEAAYPLLGIAAIAFIGGVWYDVLDAGDAVDRYNKRNGFTVAPTALRGPTALAPGLVLSTTF